jgi:CRP/FNR family transcriptional regulator, dissimilatory nitrate respiration regulator
MGEYQRPYGELLLDIVWLFLDLSQQGMIVHPQGNISMEMIDQIAAIPLFDGLPRKDLEDLAMIVLSQRIRRGQIIFAEGDDGIGFYVLTAGRVKIFKLSPDGKEQILHFMTPGEPFGEVAVFAGEPFPAYAQALEDGYTLFFPRAAFIELIRNNPALSLNMMAILSRRLRKFAATIEALSLKEVPGRLADYFLYLATQDGKNTEITLDISKNQLASLLGTIPETLSRILTRMTKEGLIETNGQREIRIVDRIGLEELADGSRHL